MLTSDLSTKRLLIGICALVCFVSAVGMWLFLPEPQTNPLLAAVTRIGIVLGALWLALPPKGESIAWQKAIPVIVTAVVLITITRKAFLYVIPIGIALAIAAVFLRPKPKRGRHR